MMEIQMEEMGALQIVSNRLATRAEMEAELHLLTVFIQEFPLLLLKEVQ